MQQVLEEPLRCRPVPSIVYKDVQHDPLLINRVPQRGAGLSPISVNQQSRLDPFAQQRGASDAATLGRLVNRTHKISLDLDDEIDQTQPSPGACQIDGCAGMLHHLKRTQRCILSWHNRGYGLGLPDLMSVVCHLFLPSDEPWVAHKPDVIGRIDDLAQAGASADPGRTVVVLAKQVTWLGSVAAPSPVLAPPHVAGRRKALCHSFGCIGSFSCVLPGQSEGADPFAHCVFVADALSAQLPSVFSSIHCLSCSASHDASSRTAFAAMASINKRSCLMFGTGRAGT
jgi:hypothetical protein